MAITIKYAIPQHWDTIHKCTGSMMQCCNLLRCEQCHFDHMRAAHTPIERQRFWKFYTSSRLIEDEPRKESVARKPKHQEPRDTFTNLDNLSENQLQELLEMLRKKGGRAKKKA